MPKNLTNLKKVWIIGHPVTDMVRHVTKKITYIILMNYMHLTQIFTVYLLFFTHCGPGSIPGRVIPKTPKMVLNTSLLNTQHYKVHIKSKVEQSRETSSALPYTLVS